MVKTALEESNQRFGEFVNLSCQIITKVHKSTKDTVFVDYGEVQVLFDRMSDAGRWIIDNQSTITDLTKQIEEMISCWFDSSVPMWYKESAAKSSKTN